MQVSLCGLECLTCLIDRMEDKFKSHIGTGKYIQYNVMHIWSLYEKKVKQKSYMYPLLVIPKLPLPRISVKTLSIGKVGKLQHTCTCMATCTSSSLTIVNFTPTRVKITPNI